MKKSNLIVLASLAIALTACNDRSRNSSTSWNEDTKVDTTTRRTTHHGHGYIPVPIHGGSTVSHTSGYSSGSRSVTRSSSISRGGFGHSSFHSSGS